jgi:hypothetical protein
MNRRGLATRIRMSTKWFPFECASARSNKDLTSLCHIPLLVSFVEQSQECASREEYPSCVSSKHFGEVFHLVRVDECLVVSDRWIGRKRIRSLASVGPGICYEEIDVASLFCNLRGSSCKAFLRGNVCGKWNNVVVFLVE